MFRVKQAYIYIYMCVCVYTHIIRTLYYLYLLTDEYCTKHTRTYRSAHGRTCTHTHARGPQAITNVVVASTTVSHCGSLAPKYMYQQERYAKMHLPVNQALILLFGAVLVASVFRQTKKLTF